MLFLRYDGIKIILERYSKNPVLHILFFISNSVAKASALKLAKNLSNLLSNPQ